MIDGAIASRYFPIVQHRLMKGESLESLLPNAEAANSERMAAQLNLGYDYDHDLSYVETPYGRVAINTLYGVMSYRGGMCSYGTKEVAAQMNAALSDPQYIGIVTIADTPGGAGNSVEVLQQTISSSSKPKVTLVEGMLASAGVWAMSGSDKIFLLSERNSEVGSIGGYMLYENIQGALEKEGRQVEIIRAPQSEEKVLVNPVEPLTEELRAEIVNDLKGFVDLFIGDVQASRTITDDGHVFKGKMYSAKEAVSIGLADGFGGLDTAIQSVIDLHVERTQSKTNNNTSNMNLFTKMFGAGKSGADKQAKMSPELSKIFGAAEGEQMELQVSEEGANQLAALESFVANSAQAYDELSQELQTANELVQAKEAIIAELEAAPANNHTEVVADDALTGNENEVETSALPAYKVAENEAKKRAQGRAN